MPASSTITALQAVRGKSSPFGSVVYGGGVNFALYSEAAQRVWLCLFDSPDAHDPCREFELDRKTHCRGAIWSVFIKGLEAGAYYAYRVEGPKKGKKGRIFNEDHYLVDPYTRLIVDNRVGGIPKSVVVTDERPVESPPNPGIALMDTIIYETHVRGMTMHPSSGVAAPGTYRALIEKIPHLKELGVTAIELLPVYECGEVEVHQKHPDTGEPLPNYWGYSPVGFFAPWGKYGSEGGRGEQLAEFRELVDALHAAGLEVILDVVYNHTSEGGLGGPLQSLKGIDPDTYFLFDGPEHMNYSGCGNTLRCNHAVTSDLIIDSLRYWTSELQVDGFRFDIAAILNRDSQGHLHQNAPVVDRIARDPVLRDSKLIAEAWDAGGGYQVGAFGTPRWSDWNGVYRDDVRRFWAGDENAKSAFALRLTGSPDIYQPNGRTPHNSINFVTCHDGFTMRDLVSYTRKHNRLNGEKSRDGTDHNISANYGIEGDTDDPEITELRMRLQKDFLTTLFLSLGVPMMLGGDEFGRTQQGNNNAYCQDNEISWFDWSLLETNRELFAFTKAVIQFRKDNPVFRRDEYFTGKPEKDGVPDLVWMNTEAMHLEWHDGDLALACVMHPATNDGAAICMMFNSTLGARPFQTPRGKWKMRINTARRMGEDVFLDEGSAPECGDIVVVGRKSMVVLTTRH